MIADVHVVEGVRPSAAIQLSYAAANGDKDRGRQFGLSSVACNYTAQSVAQAYLSLQQESLDLLEPCLSRSEFSFVVNCSFDEFAHVAVSNQSSSVRA